MDVTQYLEIFLDETKEHLQSLSDQFMILEQEPDNMDTINEIFRSAHTLKGMAGTMGYKRMQTLTHDMENVFSEVRNGNIKVKPEMIDVLFQCLDALEEYKNNIQETSDEGTNDNENLIKALNDILNDGKTEASGFTFEAGEGENPWQFSSYGMTGNAFNITGKTADAYAVSPVFDLTNRIKPISITQTFAYNYITVAQIPEYFTIAVREEGATEWTVLTAAPAPEAMNKWTYVDDYAIDLGAYEGKKIQIGYHYVADGSVCGGWQIKNILVMGKKSSAVSDITVEDSDAPVVYYNMQGVRVANPANGLYIRVQGKKATKVLVR